MGPDPFWVKDLKTLGHQDQNFNAKAETLAEKPSFGIHCSEKGALFRSAVSMNGRHWTN
jgi:hypothetical protein